MNNGDGRPLIQATKFNINGQKQYHCCPRHNNNNIDFSNPSRNNNIAQLPNNKQRHHPVVPVKEDGGHTTVMIRNIPNRFTRDMLMDFLDDHCNLENQKAKQLIIQIHNVDAEAEPIIVSAFDFLYLPMDFKEKKSLRGTLKAPSLLVRANMNIYLCASAPRAMVQRRQSTNALLENAPPNQAQICRLDHSVWFFAGLHAATNNDCIVGLLRWSGRVGGPCHLDQLMTVERAGGGLHRPG
ncbi:hypothetical protein EZV62_011616 [Acer yangbiense]|uniref:Mei2-like C-terminal RNA recognition motif domain-containing protein n=1 Tax=Acer yangbiense TaxID=1000413 RepID=A0A5C7I7P0_9ROSI|nr:hypothetical protein EZV62_011616 [Acer yangbiense]